MEPTPPEFLQDAGPLGILVASLTYLLSKILDLVKQQRQPQPAVDTATEAVTEMHIELVSILDGLRRDIQALQKESEALWTLHQNPNSIFATAELRKQQTALQLSIGGIEGKQDTILQAIAALNAKLGE